MRLCRIAGHLRSVTGKFDDDYHSGDGDYCDDADDDCEEKWGIFLSFSGTQLGTIPMIVFIMMMMNLKFRHEAYIWI